MSSWFTTWMFPGKDDPRGRLLGTKRVELPAPPPPFPFPVPKLAGIAAKLSPDREDLREFGCLCCRFGGSRIGRPVWDLRRSSSCGRPPSMSAEKERKKIEFSFAILRSVIVIPLTRHVSFLFLLTANKWIFWKPNRLRSYRFETIILIVFFHSNTLSVDDLKIKNYSQNFRRGRKFCSLHKSWTA